MPITIITTVRHNVGDDFVREGICHLLSVCGYKDEIELIHKHAPITAFYGFENIRNPRISKYLYPFVNKLGLRNRIRSASCLIQSGAPIYWCHPGGPHCSENEWFDPLVRQNFLRVRNDRRFLNIAGGSCQRYFSDGSEIETCERCRRYIAELFDHSDLTLLRDDLARRMLNIAGRDANVLPCTSIFARDYLQVEPRRGEFIVLNFMERGGHYVFGQAIDADLWRAEFKEIAKKASAMGRTIMACHSDAEERWARTLVPELERFRVPDDHRAYIEFYAHAKFGIVNRVHAAFAMASMGKPVAVIGNDSRALMIRELNLPSYYVGEIAKHGTEAIFESIIQRTGTYRDEIEQIRRRAREEYVRELSAALSL